MPPDLYRLAATPVQTFVLAHLAPLALPGSPVQDQMAPKRWATGMPLPYRWVSLVVTDDDQFSDYPLVRLHTIAATFTEAAREAARGHRRMQVLVHNPAYPVPMPNGLVADLESCETTEGPHEVPYAAESVATHFVSEYALALSLVAV